MKIILPLENSSNGQPANIKVIGVGGGGSNAVNRMIAANVSGVEFIAINTDLQALSKSAAESRLQIGEKITKGLGVGGNPEVGRQAAQESIEEIRGHIRGADMVFVTAGMGGGTGTGAAPIIAQLAREEGILTVGVVTKPFGFEGKVRMEQAENGIKEIEQYTDTLIVIPNERIFNVVTEGLAWDASYRIIDDVLRQSIQAITDVITNPGEINLDFADIRTVLLNAGTALVGIGESTNSVNIREAVEKAIRSPLLDNQDISKASKLLVNVTAKQNSPASLMKELGSIITGYGIDGHIFYGHAIDNHLDDRIKITIIATGFASKRTGIAATKPNPQPEFFDESKENQKIDYSIPAYTYWKSTKLK